MSPRSFSSSDTITHGYSWVSTTPDAYEMCCQAGALKSNMWVCGSPRQLPWVRNVTWMVNSDSITLLVSEDLLLHSWWSGVLNCLESPDIKWRVTCVLTSGLRTTCSMCITRVQKISPQPPQVGSFVFTRGHGRPLRVSQHHRPEEWTSLIVVGEGKKTPGSVSFQAD